MDFKWICTKEISVLVCCTHERFVEDVTIGGKWVNICIIRKKVVLLQKNSEKCIDTSSKKT